MGGTTHSVTGSSNVYGEAARSTPLAPARRGASLATMAYDPRDPANELYDQACSLLAAAQALRAAAGSRHAAPALAASLGCIEASLQQLREAMPELLDTALATAAQDQPSRRTHSSEASELCASFAVLARDLSGSRASCAAVRALVGGNALRLNGAVYPWSSAGLAGKSPTCRVKGERWDCSGVSQKSKPSPNAARCAPSASPTARTSAPCAEQI